MASGKGGIETALLLISIFIRLQPTNTFKTPVNDVKPDDFRLYACTEISSECKYDFVIGKLCPSNENFITTHKNNGRPTKTTLKYRKIDNTSHYCLILTLLLSGDVHYNPGPIKHPCTNCKGPVRSNQKALQYDFCDRWTHLKCKKLSSSDYNILSACDDCFFFVTTAQSDSRILLIPFSKLTKVNMKVH